MKFEDVKVGMKVVPSSVPAGMEEMWRNKKLSMYKFFKKNGFLYVDDIMGTSALLKCDASQLWFYSHTFNPYEKIENKQYLMF